jgi:glycyl-tRNA synthetase beta chain
MTEATAQSVANGAPSKDDLLIEIGCEELPPKALDDLREALFAGVCSGLEHSNIGFDVSTSHAYSTPRRLAMLLSGVAARQPDQEQDRRGPALDVAYDEQGQPSAAALGFARSLGIEVSDLQTLRTDKGSWLAARIHIAGKPLEALIFTILEQAIGKAPVPRPMRWSGHNFSFVRPVHWLVVMHGSRVLEGTLLGHDAGNLTRGHRIHAPGPHRLSHAGKYLEVLENAYVLADPLRRKSRIREQLLQTDPATRIDPELLAEVNNLVEWPVALQCAFDESFLSVPHEALVASMQDHQKFFPVCAELNSSEVSNRFVAVANLESEDPAQVKTGFERVIRPRLADARFFLEQDQKRSLIDYAPALDGVMFQKKIGSIGDKSRRITIISKKLAEHLSVDEIISERTATLAKCDLMTQMVNEFPELQGTMGRHYALHSGEQAEVAQAIEQHYWPRFSGDAIPDSIGGKIVGLADRSDTLVAIFTAGLRPSGNKDPFALRRCALGLVRILLEGRLEITVAQILAVTANEVMAQGIAVDPGLLTDVREFIEDRCRHYFREAGYSVEIVNTAMESPWETFTDLQARLTALSAFLGQEAGLSLAAANKRISNILRKSDLEVSSKIEADRLILAEEKLLFSEVSRLENALEPLLDKSDYAACLQHLSQLRPCVDRFFDAVMVMDEDAGLRRNRLALLSRLKALFDQIGDLSVLSHDAER